MKEYFICENCNDQADKIEDLEQEIETLEGRLKDIEKSLSELTLAVSNSDYYTKEIKGYL